MKIFPTGRRIPSDYTVVVFWREDAFALFIDVQPALPPKCECDLIRSVLEEFGNAPFKPGKIQAEIRAFVAQQLMDLQQRGEIL